MSRLQLGDPVTAVTGIGGRAAAALRESFGIETVRDLVEHYPRRYHDLGELTDVPGVTIGQPATLVGDVLGWTTRRIPARGKRKRPLVITEGTVQGEGGLFSVTFFNQEWRSRQLPEGCRAAFSAEVKTFRGKLQLQTPEVQRIGEAHDVVGAGEQQLEILDRHQLVPLYPATAATPTWRLRAWVATALDGLPAFTDHLPARLLDEEDLLLLDEAVRAIHQPPDPETLDAARRRLVFDELLTLQVGLQSRRARLEAGVVGFDNGPTEGGWRSRFVDVLPFKLTREQEEAFDEIAADLAGPRPMHRLLQGDVGVGKTVVALEAMLAAVDRGRQAALMVPTAVLAEQHAASILTLLDPLHPNLLDGIRIELLTSATTTSQRRRILGQTLSGETHVLIGTHALLEEGVRFRDLGLVVIDEQHRFGVSQRVTLRDKTDGDHLPDVLVMTATPIPRSLALTLYGDLDVTVIRRPPAGRADIRTELITPAEEGRRGRVYDFVRQQAANRLQTYVVCPLVEPSDEIGVTAAVTEHERLSTEVFPDLQVALVHGRMTPDAKQDAMARFRAGEADILVATTVIEVGVDVPTATIMIVEDAERFGISQLHQLRGRVGRGHDASYCVLFAGWRGPLSDEASERLEAVARTTDGFDLAETDLRIRGEGQLFGERQSGARDLKIARLLRDQKVIGHTRRIAMDLVAEDPDLSAPQHRGLSAEAHRRFPDLTSVEALQTG